MIKITISGVVQAPKWDTLQDLLRESLKDKQALLTRISRPDNRCDYRANGDYELSILTMGEIIEAQLKVEY